jgi:hypothetical protein
VNLLEPVDRERCDAVVAQLCAEIRTALARDDLELATAYLGAIETRVATLTANQRRVTR